MSETTNLRRELGEVNQEFYQSDAPFGATLLTGVNYISSARTIMYANHLNQFLNLTNPDFPKVFMGYENLVGEHSTAKYDSEKRYEITKKVIKYSLPEEYKEKEIFTLFVYSKEDDHYDIITKKRYEDLTEKYGFEYITDNIDKKEVGDIIDKGERLYHSTSYDENGNYRYGKNIPYIYLISNKTIEDGIVASESLAKSMISKSVNTVKVSLNDNDFFCNLYGTKEEYKGFPDIGEETKDGVVCSKRRIFNEQKLFDLLDRNLKRINFNSDDVYYSGGRVTDINIYCNKKPIEDIEETVLNRQILKYLREQEKYYREIYLACKEIIESGSSYSKDISFLYKKSKEILDPDVLWRDEASVFGNIVMEITLENDVGLSIGQKITGRYGNKGVIAKIKPDNEMPYLEDGTIIHLSFNTNGVINRMNEFQLFEQSITFISKRIIERMKTIKSIKAKFKLLIEFIELLNKKQSASLEKYFEKMDVLGRTEFINKVQEGSLYINIPPFWHDTPLFEKVISIYEKFDWVKPYTVYINKFGRAIPLIHDLVCGEMYVMKLKQTSEQGFSVRATGSVNGKGLPGKSNKAKNNREIHSNTPIRIGEQETLNMSITTNVQTIKKLHLFYRSSVNARNKLCKKLLSGKLLKKIKIDDAVKDRNVEILNAYLKVMGLELIFEDQYTYLELEDTRETSIELMGKTYTGTKKDIESFEKVFRKLTENVGLFHDDFIELLDKAIQKQKMLNDGFIFIEMED